MLCIFAHTLKDGRDEKGRAWVTHLICCTMRLGRKIFCCWFLRGERQMYMFCIVAYILRDGRTIGRGGGNTLLHQKLSE